MNAAVLGTPDSIASRSPGSQHASPSGTGSVNQIRIDVGQKLTVLLLALSVMVNLGCFWQMFTNERETRLKEYDLKSFQADDFSALKSQVTTQQHDIDLMRMQIILRQELKK